MVRQIAVFSVKVSGLLLLAVVTATCVASGAHADLEPAVASVENMQAEVEQDGEHSVADIRERTGEGDCERGPSAGCGEQIELEVV